MANLRLPGPTPVPEDVVSAMSKAMIDHRGKEFEVILRRLTSNMQTAFDTKNDLYFLTSSGTGALEAAITNTLSPGDNVLGVSIGNFGDRFVRIAKAYGANVTVLRAADGDPADPDLIRQALKNDSSITAVIVTHNETSTGITNDIEAIAGVVKGEFDKLLLVDAVSSLGSVKLSTDEWGLDVVCSASQKGWMCPPGVAMISVSKRAWKASEASTMPCFYFDLSAAKKSYAIGETPWTPALSILFGMDYAVQQMLAGGNMQGVYDFHAKIAEHTRNGLVSLGLNLVAKDLRYASNTVTASYLPDGITDEELLKLLQDNYDIIAAEGRGDLAGRVFRIGHMGHVSYGEIDAVLKALREIFAAKGLS